MADDLELDLTGSWEYACEATSGHFGSGPDQMYVQRGGIMEIKQFESDSGINLEITAERMWKGRLTDVKKVSKEKNTAVRWNAEGFVDIVHDKIFFRYWTKDLNNQEGYTHDLFGISNRDRSEFLGVFFQVIDPVRSVRGNVTIRRIQNHQSVIWFPK